MNRYKKSKLVVVFSILLVFSLSLLFLTTSQGIKIPYLTDAARQSMSSINSLISRPIRFLSEQKDQVNHLISTYEENQELKETLSVLENTVSENESLKNENESLRQNMEMKNSHSDKKVWSALVSIRTPNTWNQKLILNIGQGDGLSSEMLVVANGGLIGTIDSLDVRSTTVKLLTNSDDFSKIAVKISVETADIYGILSGYDTDSHSFIINQLSSSQDIPVGTNVVTSDLAGNTPSNIQIGRVTSVKTSASDLNRELYVEPTANFSNIYGVTVIGQ